MRLKHCLAASSMLTAAIFVTPALAQTAAAANAAAPDANQPPALEEVVVTARKRAEALNSVPLAVTAITSATIQRAGVTSIEKLNTLVPSFSQVPEQDPGTNVITIRGITQVRFGEPPVALVIDGVQASSPDQGTQELMDIERIEVLKGPQGSTYGRNAIGGAINIITKTPTNDVENQASVEGGQGGYFRAFAGSSGPIIPDTLLYRFSASYTNFGGRIWNETLGRDVDNYHSVSLHGRLIWRPTSQLSFDLRGGYENLDGGSAYYYPIFPGQDVNKVYPVVANRDGHGLRRLRDVSLKSDYEFDNGVDLTSITAHDYVEAATLGQDLDFLPYPLAPGFGGLVLDQDRLVRSWSEEIRLTSPSAGPLRWLVGAYYLHTNRDVTSSAFLDLGPNVDYHTVRLSYLPEINHNNAYALFGSVDYDISRALKLSLGLRQDWDDRHQTNPATGSEVQHTFGALQPRASLTYFFDPDRMVYVSAARGFRSGGFNAQSLIFPRQYNSETANTYEVGTKTALAEKRIQLNTAFFYTDQRNVQFYRWDSQTAAQGILTINSTYHYGFESELTAQITQGLRLNSGVSLIKSKIRDYNGSSLYVGNQLPHVNGWKFDLGAEYDRSLPDDIDMIARVDYQAFGDMYWFVDNFQRQKKVQLVNLRVSFERRAWTFTVSAENLFNERYNTDYFSSYFAGTPTDVGFPNQPREVKAKVAVRF